MIQSLTYCGPTSTLVSFGSLPVIGVPSGFLPSPQSVAHGSTDCCSPYLATLNPHALARSLATQPSSGTVRMLWVPVVLFRSTNLSVSEPSGRSPGLGLSLGMFSKYQSEARLVVSLRKL